MWGGAFWLSVDRRVEFFRGTRLSKKRLLKVRLHLSSIAREDTGRSQHLSSQEGSLSTTNSAGGLLDLQVDSWILGFLSCNSVNVCSAQAII